MEIEGLQISDNRYTMKQLKKRYQRRGLYGRISAFCAGIIGANLLWSLSYKSPDEKILKDISENNKEIYEYVNTTEYKSIHHKYENENNKWQVPLTLGLVFGLFGATSMGLRNNKKINELEKELEIK